MDRDAHEPPLPSAGLTSLRDLNDLEVFARVVERQGFSRAAKELGVPPSTVSRRVSRLEERLGVRLLQRTTRTLQLTEAGRVYFDRISHALREIESAEVSLQNVQGVPRGRVRVTAVNEPFVEQLIFKFIKQYPEVTVELDLSHRRADLISEGIDIAIRAGTLPDSSLVAHRLATLKTRIVASKEYLEKRSIPRTISDLKDHECVILGTSVVAAAWLLNGPKGQERVTVGGRLAVNDYGSVIAAVCAGLGIGLVSGELVEKEIAAGRLQEVLASAAPPPIDLWVVYPNRNLLSPAVRVLIDHIRAAFEGPVPVPRRREAIP